MKKKFVAIGHIVNDTEPQDHLGGGVSFTAITARNLGYETHIITKCAANSIYLKELQELGIHVHLIPTQNNTITTFRNIYDEIGRRKQQVLEQQEIISNKDFSGFPKEILKDAIILVAPVLGEVDTNLFPLLSKYGTLAVAPQGYFRKIDNEKNVTQYRWSGFEKDITKTQIAIFSEEDITIDGKLDVSLFDKFKNNVPITVLTKGEKGSIVYSKDREFHVSALRLRQDEIKDLTGAGDVYAAVFLTTFNAVNNPKIAAVKASLIAGLKIMGFGGIGTNSIPSREQLENFINKNKKRLYQFYSDNKT